MESPSEAHSPGTGRDIGVISIDGELSHKAWLATPWHELWPAVSPDGQWVAYMSNESGDYQVYVRAFAAEGAPVQVSRDGGYRPFWSRDGKTLFYLAREAADGPVIALMAAKVRIGTTQPAAGTDGANSTPLDFETPEKLFDVPAGLPPDYSAFPDGERFLTHRRPTSEQNDRAVIHVMLNAHERLKQIAPVPED